MDLTIPGLYIVAGSCGLGKTYLIQHLITHLWSKGKFKYGLVMTATKFSDQFLYLPQEYVHNYTEERLQKFMKLQKEKRVPAFLILDDIIGLMNFNKPLINHLFTTFRHYNITTLLLTQYIYKTPPTIREQANYCFCFNMKQDQSMKAIYETYFCAHFKYEEYKSLQNYHTQDHYCLVIDNKQNDMKKRYMKFKAQPCTQKITF